MLNVIITFFLFIAPSEQKCKVWGNVKRVSFNEDYKIKEVQFNQTMDVRIVNDVPNRPCEWRYVEHNEDFTIRMVQSNEDLRVRFVNRPT